MIAEIVFVCLAVVALAAAGALIVGRGGNRPPVALAAAVAMVSVLYAAPGLALVAGATLAAAGLVLAASGGLRGPRARAAGVGWRRGVMVTGVTGGLVFVLVGTWARQFMWTGRELPPGTRFGGLPELAEGLVGAPALLGVALVMVVAAAACARPAPHRI